MKNLHWYVLLGIALCSIRAAAQGDSVLVWPASVHVKRPDIVPVVLVQTRYKVFASRKMMKRYGKGDLSADLNLVSDIDASRTITVEEPMPLLDSLTGIKTSFSFQRWIGERFFMKVRYKDAPRLDTVRIKVSINKRGRFSYSYMNKHERGYTEEEIRCMMALELLDKWSPAVIHDSGVFGRRERSRKAYSEIELLITVSANPFKEELSTKK